MKLLTSTCLVILLLFVSADAWAEDSQIDQLRAALKEKMPRLEVTEISQTPIPGVLELLSEGQIFYLTPDATYLLEGSLINLDSQVNLTNQRKGKVHMASINAMSEINMLIFNPENKEATRAMTVFTDTSCPYCSKLHAEIDELLNAGVKVRYLLYPRAGLESAAYKELQSVWCAEDPQAAMTAAKKGDSIEEKVCENPIKQHVALARQVGLRGTPLIYLDSGEMVNGYRPAKELVKLIQESQPVDTQ